MTVRLRAHHLLCMLTFVGEGYTPAFIANYQRIAARLSAGEEIEVVSGPDDICAPLLQDPSAHCFSPGPARRDEAAAETIGSLLRMTVGQGVRISPDERLLRRLRLRFAMEEFKSACEGCEWSEFCSDIAGGGFRGVRVAPN